MKDFYTDHPSGIIDFYVDHPILLLVYLSILAILWQFIKE